MTSNVSNPVQQCPNKKDAQPPRDPEKKWIKFQVLDQHGKPLPNVKMTIVLPDNSSQEVLTDKNGMVEVYNIDEGNCKIESDWTDHTVDGAVHH
ncbi:MAG TPA: hypothetical protein VNW04_07955 [Puia sp.]|jgi:hypothetical protein|nr:hypothetical protein [Puia sp.]